MGALGIVVTLAYLARQIRQSTAGMQLAALFRRTNPLDLASLANPAQLSPDELIRFTNLTYIAFVNLSTTPGAQARSATRSGARRTR